MNNQKDAEWTKLAAGDFRFGAWAVYSDSGGLLHLIRAAKSEEYDDDTSLTESLEEAGVLDGAPYIRCLERDAGIIYVQASNRKMSQARREFNHHKDPEVVIALDLKYVQPGSPALISVVQQLTMESLRAEIRCA